MSTLYDLDAEECVVGACLLSRSAIDVVRPLLMPADFGRPSLGSAFDAVLKLRERGDPVDQRTGADEVRAMGAAWPSLDADLVGLLTNTPAASSAGRYAEIVARFALRRRLAGEATELLNASRDLTADPADVLEMHKARVGEIDTPLSSREPDDVAIEDFLERTTAEPTPWLIPHVMRRGWRVMVVGAEGAGKSWLTNFIVLCAAYGIHPFRRTFIEPVKVLVVDLENPEDALQERFERILRSLRQTSGVDAPVDRVWHRPGGINLAHRSDRAELENVIFRRRPDLGAIGPLYKTYVPDGKDWEGPARTVQHALDDLRTRYGFGLVIEDHAPGAPAGTPRAIRPYGSSLWLRWPELGIGLHPNPTGEMELLRWRGDRAPVPGWPAAVSRGKSWPFDVRWAEETL